MLVTFHCNDFRLFSGFDILILMGFLAAFCSICVVFLDLI